MIWPPVKAWTSKINLNGHIHFVAINYGGELLKRWVLLMSVLDSTVVVKVPWSQLVDLSKWEAGWDEINDGVYSEFRDKLNQLGQTPLPKYIKRDPLPEDTERYQTIYAKNEGAVAAPTAGLHFF